MKSAARMARALEEQFIVDGWPLGRVYGSEIELGQRYGVGRVAAREAIRILEARGTARVRCGRGGGLELTSPSLERLCERVVGYCLLSGVTTDQVRIFQEVLDRVDMRRKAERAAHNSVLVFYENCAARLASSAEKEAHEVAPRTCAEQIVGDLFQREGQRWADGVFLGNQLELCARYGVDQRALRQAIRILEAAEAAVSIPGRGHGLMTRAPGPSSISRLICCYFAATRVHHHEAFQAFNWLSMEAIGLAASRSSEQSLAPIDAMLAQLDGRRDMNAVRSLIEIEDRQLALAGNVVLDLFLRSCKAFPSWSPFSCQAMEAPLVRDLFECVAEAQAAMAANDVAAAVSAQGRKFTTIHRNLQSHIPEYSQWLDAHS